MSSELQTDVCSGGAIWWMLTGWRPGVVEWGSGVFAGCLLQVQLFVSMCNGWPHLALQHHWFLLINCHFDNCKARLVRFPCKMPYIRIPGFSLSFYTVPKWSYISTIYYALVSNRNDSLRSANGRGKMIIHEWIRLTSHRTNNWSFQMFLQQTLALVLTHKLTATNK